MEENKEYLVYYEDDSRVRTKNYFFISESNGLISFKNCRNNKLEILPVNRIVRIEGIENGQKD